MKPVFITQFENYAAAAKREGEIDLDRLVDLIRSTSAPAKAALPWLKLARFGPRLSPKGSLRHDANVLGLHGIELDYDLESMSVDTAIETAEKAGLRALIYTSPSHTPERPRWRILSPTSRELPPAERAHLVSRVNGLYGGIFATESWTLSQSYYFGAVGNNPDHQAELIDGECIDLLDELDLIAIGKPNGSVGPNGATHSSGPLDEDSLANEIVSGAGYHVACVRIIGKWAQQGVPLIEAQHRVEALFDAVFPPDRDQRWRERRADVARCVIDIYGKDAGKKDDAAGRAGQEGEASGHNDAASLPPAIIDAGEDDAPIPPRGWLLGNTFCRGFISGLVAQGAGGKTALRVAQALALATGQEITGEHVFQRSRVLIVTLEDNIDELRRRVRAARLHHGITVETVKGWLFLWAPAGMKVAEQREGSRAVVPGDLERQLRLEIVERKIDLVTIDPLIKAHGCEENDNGAIDQVAIILARLATDLGIAIDTLHHAPKASGTDPGDPNRARGASSFKDAARLLYTATGMTETEREQFGITEAERRSLIRYDSAKVNIAPPSIEARWFRIVGVPLENATELYPRGDAVPTVEPWQPPDLWREIPPAVANEILDLIERGPGEGQQYSGEKQAATTDRAAWQLVKAKLPQLSDAQCKTVIGTWLMNGILQKGKYRDLEVRKDKSGLSVIRRPG